MSERQRVFSGAPWEASAGYCRAIRVGPWVHVSGTTAVGPDGSIVAGGDPHAQALRCFRIIEEALEAAGSGLAQVVRTRMYLVDIAHWEAVARAHGEFFGEVRPATTLVQVAGLISPDMLVEVEADAYAG